MAVTFEIVNDINSNPRNAVLKKDGIVIELHKKFSYEDLKIDTDVFDEYVRIGFEHRIMEHINHHEFPMLHDEYNGLVLLVHIAEHLKSGIGLRQIIDWRMFVQNVLTDECWNSTFQELVSSIGLEEFCINLTYMVRKFLGLNKNIEWCEGANDELCYDTIKLIMDSGNFGRKNDQGGD